AGLGFFFSKMDALARAGGAEFVDRRYESVIIAIVGGGGSVRSSAAEAAGSYRRYRRSSRSDESRLRLAAGHPFLMFGVQPIVLGIETRRGSGVRIRRSPRCS